MKKLLLLPFTICLFTSYVYTQPITWFPRGVGGGGALFSPSINPANTNEYYIACDMSELFHTTDFGLTYSQAHFSQFVGGHNSKVAFTSTANLLYSISYINDIGTPVKSTDNGITWAPLAGNPDPGSDVYTIHADYTTPTRIVISAYGNIYFSGNGGTNFTSIHTAANSGNGNIVGGVFFDGNNIYIGTNDGVLLSTSGGTLWSTATITGIPATQAIFSFVGAKVGATTRFFCLTGTAADMYVGLVGSDYNGFMTGVYSCDYGTSQWVSKMTGITAGTDYPMYIDMAENDINTAYLAGSNASGHPNIMKTVNAGGAWMHTFNTTTNQNIITGWSGSGGDKDWTWGECPFGFDVSATNKDIVVFGDFGFVHKTNNGGTSWQQAYTDIANQHPTGVLTPKKTNYNSIGLEQTTCWQVLFMAAANNIWASYSDIGGIRSTDGGNSWSFNYTGNSVNSTYRVVQSANGTLYAATSNIHDMYQSTRLTDAILDAADANGKIVYSTDNGLTWTLLHSFGHPVFWVALDPNNPNRAYASVINHAGSGAGGGVYRCDNLSSLAASTWTLTPTPPRTEGHPACLVVLNDGKLVATFSGRRTSTAFTQSSGCYIYDPTVNSWTDVSHAGMNYWTKDIVVDPNDATQNTWYVGVFSGWGGAPNGLGGLYKTTNRGTSWTKLTGSTLDRVTSCTFTPGNANQIYLTTETQGLWMSNNINAGTPAFSNVANYPFRQPERVFFNPSNPNEIWVSSFGNGMKMGTLGTNGITEFDEEEGISVYPNPSSGLFNVKCSMKNVEKADVVDIMGRKIISQNFEHETLNLDLSNEPNGIYCLKIGNAVKKILVQK